MTFSENSGLLSLRLFYLFLIPPEFHVKIKIPLSMPDWRRNLEYIRIVSFLGSDRVPHPEHFATP